MARFQKASVVLLLLLFAASVALNVRLFYVVSGLHDELVVSLYESMRLEGNVLLRLENGDTDAAKTALSEAVGFKALYIGICIEEQCVGDEALFTISQKP